MPVVATAGHVDHGKSTLVRALTGTDPDRWAEEKERGLTIDLGFAGTTLPSGRDVAFVDVPGHVRFLKNMLAGVGAVNACLFVVAATEGWKPQSEEHLRILELLGVGHGLIALTKVGMVDDETGELARLDVEDHVAGTFLADAEVVAVDAPAGPGGDARRAAIDRLRATNPPRADRVRPRVWGGRACAATGAGPGVAGTLAGGSLTVGDEMALTGAGGYGARRVRVRALQTLGAERSHLGPGRRVAVNLAGVAHTGVRRGDALVQPDRWHAATTVDASLRVSPRSTTRSPAGALTSPTSARASTPCGYGCSDREPSNRAQKGRCASICPSRCHSSPATGSCCGRAGGPRPSVAARCSTWPPCAEHHEPDPTDQWTGWSRSGAGWRSTSWNA